MFVLLAAFFLNVLRHWVVLFHYPEMTKYQMWRLDVFKWTNPLILVSCFCSTEPRKQRTNYSSNAELYESLLFLRCRCGSTLFSSPDLTSNSRRGSVWVCFPAQLPKQTKKNNNSHNVTHSLKELRLEKKRAYILVSIAIVSAVTWLPRN